MDRPDPRRVGSYAAKRLLDIVISAIALAFLSPLFLVVALGIKLDSRGPVFFRGVRVGKDRRPFRIFKFRSMVVGADAQGRHSTSTDDVRITRFGRIVRRFNLDELAQLINVVWGDMSIVGPRPEVPYYVDLFTEEEKQVLLSVRPGITDFATLWIRDEGARLAGKDDPEAAYLQEIWPEKHRLQRHYVESQSMLVDFKIMLLTLKSHLFDRFKSQHLLPKLPPVD